MDCEEPWLRKTFFAFSSLLNVGSLYKAWPENVLVGWCIINVCMFYTLPTSKGTKFGHGFRAMQGRLWRRNGKEHDKARGDHGRFSLSLANIGNQCCWPVVAAALVLVLFLVLVVIVVVVVVVVVMSMILEAVCVFCDYQTSTTYPGALCVVVYCSQRINNHEYCKWEHQANVEAIAVQWSTDNACIYVYTVCTCTVHLGVLPHPAIVTRSIIACFIIGGSLWTCIFHCYWEGGAS